MSAVGISGFWSYAHDDDEAEGGRIVDLAELLKHEYKLLTGEPLELFFDRDGIAWGDDWRQKIDEALAGITFLIPVMTPTYFQRSECRRELLHFSSRAQSLGVGELLLPILYVGVPDLTEESGDEALSAAARIQYEDWRDVRLRDQNSHEHRAAVNRLAVRLVEIRDELSARPVAAVEEEPREVRLSDISVALRLTGAGPPAETGDMEEPGVLDVLAEAEAAMPMWGETITRMGVVLEGVVAATQRSVERMARSDAAGKGAAGRLVAARELARALEQPAEELVELGTAYASNLLAVDRGFGALIDEIEAGLEEEEERRSACELFSSVRQMAAQSREAVGELQKMSDALATPARYSRDLRKPLTRMQEGLRRVTDGQAIIDGWLERIDASTLDCTGFS